MDQELLNKLLNLRARLKRERAKNGRTPVVCNDYAITEMARLKPEKLQDFFSIAGVGKTFVENYGEDFLQVLKNHKPANVVTRKSTQKTKHTLEDLEKRLVNISKNNRLLYMGKALNKFAVDLFCSRDLEQNKNLIDMLHGRRDMVRICDISPSSPDIFEHTKRFKSLQKLIREVEKDYRESGDYSLYVAYPFVQGKVAGEDFNVRAPLILFPVLLYRDAETIDISLDPSKDIFYNNNLILLHNKLNKLKTQLPDNIIEKTDDKMIESMLSFYLQNGIEIPLEYSPFEKFATYSNASFPTYRNGEYHIENSVVLGKFAMYSTFMQKDFHELLAKEEINEMLDALLLESEQSDENFQPLDVKTLDNQSFSEHTLHYINDLNTSQEQAIINVSNTNELVVQGPPGTGKSQTITSLICDFAVKGKNILMVSQKKAALDVIYSRLGHLSQYAVLIHDTKDKESFYRQLKNMVSSANYADFDSDAFSKASNKIEGNLNKLDSVATALSSKQEFGEQMMKVYQENRGNQFKLSQEDLTPYYASLGQDIYDFSYPRLKEISGEFEETALLDACLKFHKINNSFPWLANVKESLTKREIVVMIQEVASFVQDHQLFLKKNFISKLFGKGKQKNKLDEIFDKYFTSKDDLAFLYKNPSLLSEGTSKVKEYLDCKDAYISLEEDQKKYISLLSCVQEVHKVPLKNLNKWLFDFIVYVRIEDFEGKNKLTLADIENFEKLTYEINKSFGDKKELTKMKVHSVLKDAFNENVRLTKRYGDIQRIISRQRKWSIGKFTQKYGFEIFKGIRIWLMTPEVVSEILPLENGLFDLLIFDEASQIYIEKGVPSIYRAKKVVIAGDHQQLRPSSLGFGRADSDEDDEEEVAALDEESLLDLARFKYPQVLLNFHYRSKYEELIDFSNYAFYEGKLNVSPNIEQPSTPPIEVIKIENGRWEGRSNKNEAKEVVSLIKKILNERKKEETLGVITFNVAQRDMILDLLDEEMLKDKDFAVKYKREIERRNNGEDIGLFVKNIENVQGDERDIIIFSLAYAHNSEGKLIRNFGWLNQVGGENRLNVAISRSKRKIYIVTSIFPEELTTDDLENEGPKLFRKYLDYSFAISSGNKELAKAILLSLCESGNVENFDEIKSEFEDDIYNKLTARGYIVDRNVGIGGYKIPFAIKNAENGNYVLGIECDGTLYHNKNTRDRDIHREKYLNARGWKIYRIWSNKWWHDQEKVLEEIKTRIKL